MSAIKRYIDELVARGELNPRTLEPYEGQTQDEESLYRNEEEEMMMYFYFFEGGGGSQEEDFGNRR